MPHAKPTYLVAVASSCQMYSGTGTAIFDWVRHAKNEIQFSFVIDTRVKHNFEITSAFCLRNDIPLHISAPLTMPGCPDTGLKGIGAHLQQKRYDFIECVSWANACTNLGILAAKTPGVKLLFTPHSQPLWTLPHHDRYFMVPVAFSKTLRAADAVFIDSPSERSHPEFADVAPDKIHFVPLGVNTRDFRPGEGRTPFQVACVCDCRETRKRVDLVLASFGAAHRRDPRLTLILAGCGSEEVPIPEDIAPAVSRMGYVTLPELVRLYQTSSLFLLISDYEAFGLPIAEALCCGSYVLLNRQPVLEDLFDGLPGVHWTRNTDIDGTGALISKLGSGHRLHDGVSEAACDKFSFERTYSRKRDIVLRLFESQN